MVSIALVDDEQSILTSVALALESEGYEVDTFHNGLEALNSLETKKYDLGLFDIKMPKMDGNELLNKVRSSKKDDLKDMPIIFLTSKDQEQDEIIGLRMGAADYITKPFSQKLLNERIKTVLRVHSNRKVENNCKLDDDQNIKKGDLAINNSTGPSIRCCDCTCTALRTYLSRSLSKRFKSTGRNSIRSTSLRRSAPR